MNLPLDGTTTNSSSDEHQRILLRQSLRQQMLTPSSTTNSFNEENYQPGQTTIPLIHSIPELPSVDNHDHNIEEYEDDELVHNHHINQSDIEEETPFPVEDYDEEDDECSTRLIDRRVDVASIHS